MKQPAQNPIPCPVRQQAFTLVELLVVVTILGILAAFVVPALISQLDPQEPGAPTPEARATTAPPTAPEPLPGTPPVIERADIRVRVTAREQRHGATALHRYTAEYAGELVLQPTAPDTPLRFSLPLPDGAEEAEGVQLTLHGAGYDGPVDLRNLRVGIDGIHWSGPVPRAGRDATLTAKVAFTVRGTGRLVLRLPAASGIRSVQTRVDLVDLPELPIPSTSLEPKSVTANPGIAGHSYLWQHRNLVSHRPIIVDLPALESPRSRVLFTLQLAGLAVFLFGCGFWYLVERYQAGRLTDFRWRHFLLLGSTYSLFFAVFAVGAFQGLGTWTALALAAGTSLPLLVWHVASIVDWRFAAIYTVPLAALTIGVVVNGVYGGAWRSYVYLAAAALVIGYLTLTIEGLVASQDALRERREAAQAEQLRRLASLRQELADADRTATALLGRLAKFPAAGEAELREQVTADHEAAQKLLAECFELDQRHLGLTRKRGLERRLDREGVTSGLFGMADALAQRRDRLVNAHDRLAALVAACEDRAEAARARKERQRKAADERARRQREQRPQVHCIACGHGWPGSRHCPQCGARRPEELTCKQCSTDLPLPVHLLDPQGEPQLLYCPSCGQCHSGVTTDWLVGN